GGARRLRPGARRERTRRIPAPPPTWVRDGIVGWSETRIRPRDDARRDDHRIPFGLESTGRGRVMKSQGRRVTAARITALPVAAVAIGGMAVFAAGQNSGAISVPAGARAGQLELSPCEYQTEAGDQAADCGKLIVPENRHNPHSRLIALPVTRVRAKTDHPA